MLKTLAVAAVLLVPSLLAQTSPTKPPSNPELTALYNEDQRIRQPKPLTPEERAAITRTDADRLAAVKQMIALNQVQTTADYLHAALIVQHSHINSDYLLAHTLAILCAADGDKTCVWLTAATLDRYLQSVQQPQIYGTQTITRPNTAATKQPYTPDLITDGLRRRLGVPSIQDQQKEVDQLNAHRTESPASAAAPIPPPR